MIKFKKAKRPVNTPTKKIAFAINATTPVSSSLCLLYGKHNLLIDITVPHIHRHQALVVEAV